MLVKCVDNSGVEKYLTIGKVYEVFGKSYGGMLYTVINDRSRTGKFAQSRFEKAGAGDQGSDNQTKQNAR